MSTIWDFAKKMEEEGAAYYRTLAEQAPSRELAGVLLRIAAEEEGHFSVFDALSKAQKVPAAAGSTILGDARQTFARLAETSAVPVFGTGAASMYEKALQMEKNSVAYYEDALRKTSDAGSRLALGAIIAEETNHARIVEGLVEFVRRPADWLEDAEFNKFEGQ